MAEDKLKKNISVIVCTHNPRQDYILLALGALRAQTLNLQEWELLLIDNASDPSLENNIDVSWHPSAQYLLEGRLGLTHARLRGIQESNGEIIIFVDDDNVLSSDYLQNVYDIFNMNPKLGAIGGKILPEYKIKPAPWFFETNAPLGCRDLGDEIHIDTSEQYNASKTYPEFAPIGAGIALRRSAAVDWSSRVRHDQRRIALGRVGKGLSSGEDNDIVLTLLEEGWGVGYFPQLKLTHLIPAERLAKKYLAKLSYESSKTWIRVLDLHGICSWKRIPRWTILPREIKAFFTYRAWSGPASYVRWQGACGMLEGLGTLTKSG